MEFWVIVLVLYGIGIIGTAIMNMVSFLNRHPDETANLSVYDVRSFASTVPAIAIVWPILVLALLVRWLYRKRHRIT